jgi:hypothetical protein
MGFAVADAYKYGSDVTEEEPLKLLNKGEEHAV